MPELAEVEYFRRQWDAGLGEPIVALAGNFHKSVYRDCEAARLRKALPGSILRSSERKGKQMLFRVDQTAWLGLHLGMTGELSVRAAGSMPGPHDHFVLHQRDGQLVFRDYRTFGRVLFAEGEQAPEWWANRPPEVLDDAFTPTRLREYLKRHPNAPLKALLLDQAMFPGIGNWLADEILWRARIFPALVPQDLSMAKQRELFRQIKSVCAEALEMIGEDIDAEPEHWLYPHRWRDGGSCPATGEPLIREKIGGRTTCYSPRLQKPPTKKTPAK